MAASDKGSDKNTEVITQSDPNEDYGYYFFPRRQDQQVKQTQTNFERFKQNPLNVRAGKDHYNCKLIVKRCFISDPLVNLMIRAMKAHGCPVEHDRHIVCEPCRLKISGGMDYINNQVVVCENNARSLGSICNVMAHELLHAFDKCRSNFDYRNPEHIACTEIRAANLLHCSFSAAMSTGSASPFRIKEQQQQCVKDKASISLMIARNISKEKANEIINKVFSRCYNDLEPVGRRLRKGTLDDARALLDADLYGYFR